MIWSRSEDAAAERGRWSSRRNAAVNPRFLRGEALHALPLTLGAIPSQRPLAKPSPRTSPQDDRQPSGHEIGRCAVTLAIPPRLLLLAMLSLVANLTLLLQFAWTTSLWDDEVNTFFLARLPASQIVAKMAMNHDEDAPLFTIIEHVWIHLADYNGFMLRLLPFAMWCACLLGLGVLAYRLAGRAGLLTTMIVASAWPYHWINPVSLRWYSTAAAILVWNLLLFTELMHHIDDKSKSQRRKVMCYAALYSVTGAMLWYTVYAAPAFFAAQLVIVMARRAASRQAFSILALCWLTVVVLYLPWFPTWIRQLGRSVWGYSSVQEAVKSMYCLIAGHFSTPDAIWISIPLSLSFLCASWLVVRYWRYTHAPAIVACIAFLALTITGVVHEKRLLIITVPTSIAVGIAISTAWTDRASRYSRQIVVMTSVLALLGLSGTLMNAAHRSGWLTYRWLDNTSGAVDQVKMQHPEALLLSNSNSVAFYARDAFGFFLGDDIALDEPQSDPTRPQMGRVWNTNRREHPVYGRNMSMQIDAAEWLAYVHVGYFASNPARGTAEELRSVLDWLKGRGYEQVETWYATPVEKTLSKYVDLSPFPSHRVSLVFLRRTPSSLVAAP